jgi:tetratricopeptide (TPR) repeat protein
MQDLKAEATGLYRSKNFSGAAQAINASLAGFGPDDAKDLKTLAGIYSQLGKAYAVGMAYGTRATDALPALQRALSYDREVGGAYGSEIRERIGVVAPKAASSFMAAKSFEQALQSVRVAESVGSTSESLKSVRSSLDGIAHELLSDARRELSSDPDDAKQKLRQVLAIVEPKTPLYVQAQKLLNGQ